MVFYEGKSTSDINKGPHFWNSILGPFWDHFGTVLGPFWDHFGTVLGPFWDSVWINV